MADAVTMAMAIMGAKVVGGIQEFQQNRAMAQATKQQTAANIANQQAAFEIEKGKLSREQAQFAGRQRTIAAGTGATLSSFDTLFEDTSRLSAVDQALLEYDNKLQQESIRYEGAMRKKQFYMQGRSALLNSAIGAGETFAGSPGGKKAIDWASSGNSMGQSIGAARSKSTYGPFLKGGSRMLSGYS
jgi:hypothetical protein